MFRLIILYFINITVFTCYGTRMPHVVRFQSADFTSAQDYYEAALVLGHVTYHTSLHTNQIISVVRAPHLAHH